MFWNACAARSNYPAVQTCVRCCRRANDPDVANCCKNAHVAQTYINTRDLEMVKKKKKKWRHIRSCKPAPVALRAETKVQLRDECQGKAVASWQGTNM